MNDTHERIGDIWMEYIEKSEPLTSDEAQCPPLVIVSILISRMEEDIARNGGSITVRIMPDGVIWMVRTSEDDYFNESRLEATYQAWQAIQEQQQ